MEKYDNYRSSNGSTGSGGSIGLKNGGSFHVGERCKSLLFSSFATPSSVFPVQIFSEIVKVLLDNLQKAYERLIKKVSLQNQ